MQTLTHYPLALLKIGACTRNIIEKMAIQNGISLQPMAEINDTNLLLQMVRTGDWVSILSRHRVDSHPELRAIPLKEKGGDMQVSIFQSKGRYKKWLRRNLSKSFRKSLVITNLNN